LPNLSRQDGRLPSFGPHKCLTGRSLSGNAEFRDYS